MTNIINRLTNLLIDRSIGHKLLVATDLLVLLYAIEYNISYSRSACQRQTGHASDSVFCRGLIGALQIGFVLYCIFQHSVDSLPIS